VEVTRLDPQEKLAMLRKALGESKFAREVAIEWEDPTAVWRTARLVVRRGELVVTIFEDLDELVCIPPDQTYPHSLPYVTADATAEHIFRILGL